MYIWHGPNNGSSRPCNFITKKNMVEVFSCYFFEIFYNTFFYGTPPMVAFDYYRIV